MSTLVQCHRPVAAIVALSSYEQGYVLRQADISSLFGERIIEYSPLHFSIYPFNLLVRFLVDFPIF